MNLNLIGGASVILISWVALFVGFAGIGLLPGRRLGLRVLDEGLCFQAFWLGLSLAVLFLQVYHLFLPVTWHAQVILATAAVAGLYSYRRHIGGWFSQPIARPTRVKLALFLIVGLWLANHATAACCSYDTAMYDLPAVLWTKTYPIVPGLGNLNERLAFNNASYLYAALLDSGPWSGLGNHLSNGLLLLVILCAASAAGVSLWHRLPGAEAGSGAPLDEGGARRLADSHAAFAMALITPAIVLALRPQISSYNSNLAAAMIAFAGATSAHHLMSAERDDRRGIYPVVATAAMLTAAVAFKLNVAVFSSLVIIGIIRHWWKTAGAERAAQRRKVVVWVVSIGVTFGLLWITRSIILSGYPAFPSTVLPAPVSWRIPTEQAEALTAFIRQQGRVPWDDHYSLSLNGQWVGRWMRDVFLAPGEFLSPRPDGAWSVVLPGFLCAMGLLLSLQTGGRRWRPRPDPGSALLLPGALGAAFWFTTAPQPRLGLALLWILAATAIARLVALRTGFRESARRRWLAVGLVLVGLSPALLGGAARIFVDDAGLMAAINRYVIVPGPSSGLFHPMPEPRVHRYVTTSGLALWVPDGNDLRCWDAPLPCTPFPAPNIRLRKGADLRHGFETVGPWQSLRWPTVASPFKESWLEYRRGQAQSRSTPDSASSPR